MLDLCKLFNIGVDHSTFHSIVSTLFSLIPAVYLIGFIVNLEGMKIVINVLTCGKVCGKFDERINSGTIRLLSFNNSSIEEM